MRKGFLIGGGFILLGLMLQLGVGPVVWDALAWPVNGIVMIAFLLLIAVCYLFRKKASVFRFVGTYQAAIPALVYAVLLTIVMGLIRQNPEGKWLENMLVFWPFVLIYVYMALILGVVVVRQLVTVLSHFSLFTSHFSLLSHMGLFLAMTTATLGNADMQRLKMVTTVGEQEWRAVTSYGTIQEMPMTIELKQFIMETYDDGSPKRFASDILVRTKDNEEIQTTIDVNKPVEVDGWKIYQYSYDTQMGPQSQISILELVSDPWLPLVYTGIYMLLAGAVCMFIFGGKKK
ncbi:cytochrome c biogenesis protein ResB [uncultured Prevotella sp.]|uniref:cytochrome c biogenesis protein ResB n=1 Tax=uncultured Prevotella sp. TaxID=159272 RepID=UPI0025D5D73F|nr:cytochrome c biogenesis protein ResB [uncultured Prevotella sp.]